MENKIEEYKKQFKTEETELIVRISWCWKRGSSGFSKMDNYYKVYARFDKALNVKTGELLETGVAYNWIRWLAPEKSFGFKYGYKLKEGHMYRILAREYISKEDDKFKAYYLEKMLEKDVKEPRLDALNILEKEFKEEVMDLTVLIKKKIGGWVCKGNYKWLTATFIASIDHKTNEVNTSYGNLTWMEKGRKSKIKFNFDGLGTYHVRVRRDKEDKNRYLLLDVIKKVKDNRLESIKENYLKPVIITSELGQFTLDRNYNWFIGQTDYLGDKCSIRMEVGEGETTADRQLDKLCEIFNDLKNWDNCVKEFATKELLQLANDWSEDEVEITKEQFVQRIGMPVIIVVGENGSVEVEFGDDTMFADHSIEIYIDENGEFEGADIVG